MSGFLNNEYELSGTGSENSFGLPDYGTSYTGSAKAAKKLVTPKKAVAGAIPSLSLGNDLDTDFAAFSSMDDAGKLAFADAGGTIDGVSAKTMIPEGEGFNYLGAIGAGVGLGQLALGYGQFQEAKKNNRTARRAADFNLAEAKKDRAATDAYRKSYGV